jgi:hypothetical protein
LAAGPAALVLAGDMVGAILVSGLARRQIIGLTLAPAELLAMPALLAQRAWGSEAARPQRTLSPTLTRR